MQNYLIWLEIANHKDQHFKFQIWSIRIMQNLRSCNVSEDPYLNDHMRRIVECVNY